MADYRADSLCMYPWQILRVFYHQPDCCGFMPHVDEFRPQDDRHHDPIFKIEHRSKSAQ